jgi:hypothetical protein
MPEITVTFQSNLTASASGATVTSASTSKVANTPSATPLNQTHLTQSIPTSATSIDLGAIDTTKAYALRFRNTDTTNNCIVLATYSGTDRIVGIVRPGSMFGPIDVPGSGYNGGGSLVSPAGWKLQSVSAATVIEVVGVQQSDGQT